MEAIHPSAEAAALIRWFEPYPAIVVALSGGVDSAVVAAAAVRALGRRARAVTADSPSVPRSEVAHAVECAQLLGIPHELMPTDELSRADYVRNDGTRCYYCKSTLYDTIRPAPGEVIVSGANLDDLGDYRPGLVAAAERGVRHPLQELGFGKAIVRQLAQEWGLPVAQKPASPCLASRLAPGVEVTVERLARVEAAETYLKQLGLRDVRVRYHADDLARIEIPPEAFLSLWEEPARTGLARELLRLGFRYVTIDLEPLRSGSLNQLVPLAVRQRVTTSPSGGIPSPQDPKRLSPAPTPDNSLGSSPS